ncbi:hypothetical protein N9E34_07175 [Opitutales bacterium]|nr:hypothetical protein [Opitutales bacterium]
MTTHICHCEEDGRTTRQSIVSCTLPGAQWIATGYALAMTRGEVMQCAVRLQHALVIASWKTVRCGNPSCLVRFLEHSGSPRATPSR